MNLREVREAAARLHNGWHSHSPKLLGDYETVCDFVLATIDPSPDEPITADWLREVWGWSSYGTMSMHYDHDEYTAFSWRQEDGLSFVAKSHQMRCYTTGFPVATRQQFCDLARCLGIPRKQPKPEPEGCTCLSSPNMLYAPCSYCDKQRKDGVK